MSASRTSGIASRREEQRHHVVTGFQVPNTGSDFLHDARALVSADDGHRHPCQIAGKDMVIGMAKAGSLEGHQDLAVLRTVEVNLLDTPRRG